MSNPLIWTASLLLCIVTLPSSVGASVIECNNLKRFRCKRGGEFAVYNGPPGRLGWSKGPANGCTWKRDPFKKYRRFPIKKEKLFGICLNAGQSESEFFGTPAERCDCGTKCMRKCKFKRGYKNKCYWASRDGSPRGLAGTCLPNRQFAEGEGTCSSNGYSFDDTSVMTAATEWHSNTPPLASTLATYGDISCWNISEVTSLENVFYQPGIGFNADISKWDTAKVTTLTKTFMGAEEFNADLSKWDTSKVINTQQTFSSAKVFNADLSKWEMSEVTTMQNMFYDATIFNADLKQWNTSKVANMQDMFDQANAFKCVGDCCTADHLPSGRTTGETNCNNT